MKLTSVMVSLSLPCACVCKLHSCACLVAAMFPAMLPAMLPAMMVMVFYLGNGKTAERLIRELKVLFVISFLTLVHCFLPSSFSPCSCFFFSSLFFSFYFLAHCSGPPGTHYVA